MEIYLESSLQYMINSGDIERAQIIRSSTTQHQTKDGIKYFKLKEDETETNSSQETN